MSSRRATRNDGTNPIPGTRTFLFAGDSITDAGRDRALPRSLGEGYVQNIAKGLHGAESVLLNAGVGGDRIDDLLRRWDRDVLKPDPDVITIYIGINDTWRRYSVGETTPLKSFITAYRQLIETSLANRPHRKHVLIEPFVDPVTESQRCWAEDLGPKQTAVRELAREYAAHLVPLADTVNEYRRNSGPGVFAPDGVHPSVAGHRVIADLWRRTALRYALID